MVLEESLSSKELFSKQLCIILTQINSGIAELELYEFRYALANITPVEGWYNIKLPPPEAIELQIREESFFTSIQFKPRKEGQIVLDEGIVHLTQLLFVGLVRGEYSTNWVNKHFYFDIRAFIFLVRTRYFNQAAFEHFGGHPHIQFEPLQNNLESKQDLGYQEFSEANRKVDGYLVKIIERLIQTRGTPMVLTLAGPTGAGKTEIIHIIQEMLVKKKLKTSTIEMDNFYKDGSYREGKVFTKDLIHYDLFIKCLNNLQLNQSANIPKYDFLNLTSSHDLESKLRSGASVQMVHPADVIFLEGNYPFHQEDVAPLVGTKIAYLTDDPIRLKRKWRRDIDYRKKYDPFYFINRYFRTQIIRAHEIYSPLLSVCDVAVDTTSATIWLTPEMQVLVGLSEGND
ncbi:MAG: hypothetical protein MUO40_02125 [Anaerolineaceae bacterium]|nr:hypothetical protein [Anaerolineaceae bacterium]